ASIINQLVQQDLIEKYHLTMIPTILGEGIHLFDTFEVEHKLKLIETNAYNGMVDLVYEPRVES
ncbi:MAG: dihydrofolate reductase family protein, partial [Cellulosilyticaceae bacterium]